MSENPIIIACRDYSEAERIRTAIAQPSSPAFYRSTPFLDHLSAAPDSFLIMTSLIMDETAIGLITKSAIVHPSYSILYASHCQNALNLLRIYGSGCAVILGPDELPLIQNFLSLPEGYLEELVMPPFFIDDDESSLKSPDLSSLSFPLHVTFLGSQSLMSCANALLNIKASPLISMSCIGPKNEWALEHLSASIRENTLWSVTQKPTVSRGGVTLCHDFNALAALEPTSKHFIICHGLLSDDELQYMDSLPDSPRIFQATLEGYVEKTASALDTVLRPEKLWDLVISTLYGD